MKVCKFYSFTELSNTLGVSKNTIRFSTEFADLMKKGRPFKGGRKLYWTEIAIENFIKNNYLKQ